MYQALYRKYRPRSFSEVVGQEHITQTLRRQVETGRTSHAYLFVGTRGTGKTTCAKILSRAVNCEHPVNGDPCNQCAACRGIESGSVLDVVEIDAASNNGVDNIRTLRDEAVYTPASVRKRVYIVDEVHMLSTSAFNALLKILEEPPEHLIFILATTELRKIPATILSRCQHFSFKRLEPMVIQKRLSAVAEREGFSLTEAAAALLARLADGSMRDGLSLLDQCASGNAVDEKTVAAAVGLMSARSGAELWNALRGDLQKALDLFEKSYQGGAEPSSVLSDLLSLNRDMLILRAAPVEGTLFLSGAMGAEELCELSKGLEPGTLLKAAELLQNALVTFGSVRDKRTAAELCLVKLSCMLSGVFADICDIEREKQQEPSTRATTTPRKPPTNKAAALTGPPRESDVPWEDAPPPRDSENLWEDAPPPMEKEDQWNNIPAPVKNEVTSSSQYKSKTKQKVTASSVVDDGELWDRILQACSGEVEQVRYQFLANRSNVLPEYMGNELVLHVANDFLGRMVGTPDVIGSVAREATAVLGRSVKVSITTEPLQQTLKDDKLDQLKRFKNVVFEE